jgi:hypothetical protein
MAVDSVVGHHMNPFRSGVARFNEILAERLGVPLVGLDGADARHPLLSFKVAELDEAATPQLEALLERCDAWSLFLHDWNGLELEQRLAAGAGKVWCANHEVLAAVEGLAESAETLWAPGLVSDLRRYEPASVSVFSFGMAHKIQTERFSRMKQLLDSSGDSYALYVSSANHETASIRDAELVYREMHAIFPERLYFLGNLSDVAVFNYLSETTYFAAFFSGGVRANNTSVASAMEHGAVVVTNLDEHSPPDLVHMENVIDLEQAESLPSDPLTLRRLSVAAMETAGGRSWDALIARLGGG